MIRKDREVTDLGEIVDILRRCDTVSVGFKGGEHPYVVPVSFGVVQNDTGLYICFHGAKRGFKAELAEKDAAVCVEAHVFHGVEQTDYGITTRYESVIGFGRVERAEGGDIVEGLQSITEHYGRPEYPIVRCKGLPMTAVYRVKIERISGKRNLPG